MIFCVEDDDGIRNMVVYTLNASGYKAEGFRDGAEFTEALKSVKPELVMLDIMLPGDDGITLLKRLKENPITADIPVIMATAKGTEYDKVTGLDLGADDYLAKPFGMMEMVSRVRAVLRRSKTAESADLLTAEGLVLNPTEHTVTVDGEQVQLTLKEYELLRLFMENRGRAFTRDAILSSVWGTEFVGETRTVDVHVGTLRTKIGKYGDYIKTVRGVGYRMEAPSFGKGTV